MGFGHLAGRKDPFICHDHHTKSSHLRTGRELHRPQEIQRPIRTDGGCGPHGPHHHDRLGRLQSQMQKVGGFLQRIGSLRQNKAVRLFGLVGFAGYASEDVFYKELGVIDPLMRERFDAEGRSVLLVNNPKTVLQLPIASNTHLRRSLRAIGQKINRDEDVVVLYLTSHGSADPMSAMRFALGARSSAAGTSECDSSGKETCAPFTLAPAGTASSITATSPSTTGDQ